MKLFTFINCTKLKVLAAKTFESKVVIFLYDIFRKHEYHKVSLMAIFLEKMKSCRKLQNLVIGHEVSSMKN